MKSDFGEGTLWFENIIIVLLHPAQLIAEYLIRTFGCPLPIVPESSNLFCRISNF